MSGIDPNLWSSLARRYLGGMNAPSSGQAGYKLRVTSAADNVEYVPARFVLGAAGLAQANAATTALDQEVYAELTGTFAAVGTPDTCIAVAASGVGFTWRGATPARLLLQATARVQYNGASTVYAACWHVDGVPSAFVQYIVVSSTAQQILCLPALLDVPAGSTVSLRVTNTANGTDMIVQHLSATALALEIAA